MVALFEQLEKRDGATDIAVAELLGWVSEKHENTLPADCMEFLCGSNGTVGRGPDLHIILNKAEEITGITEGYGAAKFAPGLVIVGGDGYGNLIGIDCRKASLNARRYLRTDPLSTNWEEQPLNGAIYGATLLELLRDIAE